MYKKIILTTLSLAMLLSGKVLAQNDYVMFLTEVLNPIPGKSQELVKGIQAHNAKFHVEGDDKAYIFSILTGPRSGQFTWIQGPIKYGKLDQTLSDEHTADWDKNVASNCQTTSQIQMLRRDDELSYNPENEVVADKSLARIFYGISDMGTLREAVGMIKKVFEAKKWENARRVYVNDFRTKENEDLVLIYPFTSFAEFEKYQGIPTDDLEKDFESVHGAGSFAKFIEMIQSSSEGWYDEVRVMIK